MCLCISGSLDACYCSRKDARIHVNMPHFAVRIIAFSLLLCFIAPSRAGTASEDLSSVHPGESPSVGPVPTEAASRNGFSVPDTLDPARATESETTVAAAEEPAAEIPIPEAVLPEAIAHHSLRTREGEDAGGLPDADPPSLWLNSLDSLRCVKESTTAPGTGACDGPEAWERTVDGSRGVYFVAVGDTGQPSTSLRQVAATMAGVCSAVPVSFVSLLGDNFYPSGVSSVEDPKFFSHFEDPFGHPALQRVCCHPPNAPPTLARGGELQFPWSDVFMNGVGLLTVCCSCATLQLVVFVFCMPQWQPAAKGAGEGARARGNSMTVVNIHLDSNILLSRHHAARKQVAFLEAVLQSETKSVFVSLHAAAAAEADWIFVHQHHPLFTDGTLCRNIKSFQDLLMPVYLRYGVDAIFAGHEHLLSYFELDGPGSTGGPVAQVISGSGSKLHRSFPKCCTPSLLHQCKEDEELCRSSNCSFQLTTSGFALVNLTAKEMRVLYVDANTGDVIYDKTRQSKKNIRMQKIARYAGFEGMRGAAEGPLQSKSGAFAYPRITRELIPVELTGSSWPTEDFPLWGHVMVVLLIILSLVLAFTFCRRVACKLKACAVPQARRYSLPSWTLRRQPDGPVDLHETPTIVGSLRSVSVGREVELGPRDTRLSVGSLPVVEATRACELRRQKDQEEMPFV
ncbi:serine/threonine protein phosphatase, putative [Eimeria praecox]|uniref:Serine/threonine protein phosphatase, putative n=1 Tax=Eimeria praecox TaxID=51316 RepID=U6H6U2_9EIME|nr:serine/threonine protein phosphatase, putative [Eimeria praecox]